MLKIIHFVQNLSLDITAGAVIMTLFLGNIFNVEITGAMITGLAVAIWLIYTTDHLFDAYKLKSKAVNPRHAFHQKYFKILIAIALVVFVIGIWNLSFLPKRTVVFGFVLAALSAIYLGYSYLSSKPFNKEIFAAFVYTAGIVTAPLSILPSLEITQLLIVFQLFLLAYANLLIIPIYEHDIDLRDHHNSVATLRGASMVKQRVLLMCSLSFVLVALQYFLGIPNEVLVILSVMTFVLFTLINRQDLFRKYQLFRIMADGIFFLPGITLLL